MTEKDILTPGSKLFLVSSMVLFIQTAKHSPESCPRHNAAMKKVYDSFNAKKGAIYKKYGIKVVGSWAITQEHVIITIFEVQDPGAMIKLMKDRETGDWQSRHIIKTRPLVTWEDAMKMLK